MQFLKPAAYQPHCLVRFNYFEEELKKLLPEARVEHIGASSITGAISKGDLDIFIGVEHPELEESVQSLLILGFTEKPSRNL